MSEIDWKPAGPEQAGRVLKLLRHPCETCGVVHAVTFPKHNVAVATCKCGSWVLDRSGERFSPAS